eukprot:1014773-Amphidinium_carterae.1
MSHNERVCARQPLGDIQASMLVHTSVMQDEGYMLSSSLRRFAQPRTTVYVSLLRYWVTTCKNCSTKGNCAMESESRSSMSLCIMLATCALSCHPLSRQQAF